MDSRRLHFSSARIGALLFGLALAPAPARAADAPHARLVHCGEDTCLLLSGHRARADVTARIGAHDLALEGGRAWRVAIPLETVRSWAVSSGYSLTVSLVDAQVGSETNQVVILPPGALGRPVELASLVVRGH